jgi:predicted nucleotidyltransferase
LNALICAGTELSTSDAARIADVSNQQASRVLAQLVELGIVERREVPPAVVYQPVEGNFVVGLLLQLCNARTAILEQAARSALKIRPAPLLLGVFGSVARGTSDALSDIDILVVRPVEADENGDWYESLDRWRADLEAFAGTRVNTVEVSADEAAVREAAPDRFWAEIRRDLIEIYKAGQDHKQTLALLETVQPNGKDAARRLRRLLDNKTKVEYDPLPTSSTDARHAVERAQQLVAMARAVVTLET